MRDWKPGDTLIFIHGHPEQNEPRLTEQPLRIGQRCTFVGLTTYGNCETHGITFGVQVAESHWRYCPGCFRKPIDFSELLKIKTIHIKEIENV